MENVKDIFENELLVDEEVNSYLSQTAAWAKFTGILGICFAILSIIKTIYSIVKLFSIVSSKYYSTIPVIMSFAISVLSGVIYFAISLFTLRFALRMQEALAGREQLLFERSWYNLKIVYRLVGIVCSIYLLLIIISFLFMSMSFL